MDAMDDLLFNLIFRITQGKSSDFKTFYPFIKSYVLSMTRITCYFWTNI